MTKFILLLLAAFIAGQASAADGDRPSAAAPNYTVNFDSRRALEWHNLEKPITRGLVIDIVVNGRVIKAAIDSGTHGAGLLQMRSSLAAGLGVMPTGAQVSSQTYGGSIREATGVASSVTIGGVSFSNAPVRIEGLAGVDDDVEAVIGSELLKYVTLVIDPGNHRLRFLLPGELAGLKSGRSVISLEDSLHAEASSVEVTLCGNKTKMVVDTGDNADLTIRATLFRRAGCKSSVESDVRSQNAGGPTTSRRTGVPNAAMDRISFGPVLVQEIANSQADALGIDGGLGLGVLGRFISAIDVTSRRLAILGSVPESGRTERPTIGLQVRRTQNALEVLHVEAHSPASRSPLKAGDRICFVDGVPMSTLGERFNTNPAPGTELKLTTCDGRTVSITASDSLFPAGLPRSAHNNFEITQVGDFTTAMNDCVWGDDKGKSVSCTKVIDAPPETRSTVDLRVPAYLYRAKGEAVLGSRLIHSQKARAVARATPERKLTASLS